MVGPNQSELSKLNIQRTLNFIYFSISPPSYFSPKIHTVNMPEHILVLGATGNSFFSDFEKREANYNKQAKQE
jgi:hypothetical protein